MNEYTEAVMNQSYPEMKKVAQKLLNYVSIESITEKFITYTKYFEFRQHKYELDVYINPDSKEWNWDIHNEDLDLVNYGHLKAKNEDEVFNEIFSDISYYIEKENN